MPQTQKNQGAFQTLRHTMTHTVQEVRHLTEQTFVLRCTRGGLQFIPGQHLSVGPKNDLNMREYSIYSGVDEDFLEILVIEVVEGVVSKALKRVKPNQEIKIEGPFGTFIIEEEEKSRPLYMIATGTGISPFHCFALSYPHLPFTVLHGVRHAHELYDNKIFAPAHIDFKACISQDKIEDIIEDNIDVLHFNGQSNGHFNGQSNGHFNGQSNGHPNGQILHQGRVTDYLKNNTIDTEGVFFLCGNCDMIYEAFDILQQKGVSPERIKAEVYF